MTFVSYAQNFEDVMLWRALGHVRCGFYIDVGAQSPDLDSVTRAFSDAGWSGISIEPHPRYYADLVERRPRDINLQCAVGEQAGMATIHLVGATGLSTLDASIADVHNKAGYSTEQIEVEVQTLNQIWSRYVPASQEVHFLKVDVEGFEGQVLRGNEWSVHRPWVVVVEATAPNSQAASFAGWEPQLLDSGYLFVYEDGLNRFYVAREHQELNGAFRHPPNVFDGFILASLARTQDRLKQTETARQQLQAHNDELERSLEQTRTAWQQAQVHNNELKISLEHGKSRISELTKLEEELREALVGCDEQLQEWGQRYRALEQERSSLHTRMTETAAALKQAESERAVVFQEVERLRKELLAVYQSSSWRLTIPLRYVGRFLPAATRRLIRPRR